MATNTTTGDVCKFTDQLASSGSPPHSHDHSHDHASHDHDHSHSHSHSAGGESAFNALEHGHTHEHLEHAGKFAERDLPDYSNRNFKERAFTIGIGGYVVSPSCI